MSTDTETPAESAAQHAPAEPGKWLRRALSAIAGIVAAGVALGVAELLAGLVGPNSSPVIAIGGAVIDATPRPLKDFAITTFGENDKIALVIGTLALLLVFSIVIGLVAWTRLKLALAGVALFGVLGVAAALTRPAGSLIDAIPSLIGGAAGVAALAVIITAMTARSGRTSLARASEESRSTTHDRSDATEDPAMDSPHADKPIATEKARVAARERTGESDASESSRVTGHDSSDATSGTHATREHADQKLMARLRERLGSFDRKGAHLDRRGFFIAGGVAAGAAVVAGGAGTLLQRRFAVDNARDAITLPSPADPAPALPAGADLSETVDGLTPLFTDNNDFYRVDTAITVPQVSPSDWSLRIFGMVDQEVSYTFSDLMDRDDLIERDITLSCVSNEVGGTLASSARWIGVPLRVLLDEAGVSSDSDQLVSRSVDGMTIGTATSAAMDTTDAMIAIGMNGEPLVVDHGFPARMLIPGQYGYVSACKWITEIEVTTFDAFDAYWVEREWDREAPIKVFSRIDTPIGLQQLTPGPRMVAGIAWAQTRGIATVEVKIDDADWVEAELSPEVNLDLWRQWMVPVDWDQGPHTIVCRATDQDGTTQPEERVPPFPNGATGWHNITATVSDSA